LQGGLGKEKGEVTLKLAEYIRRGNGEESELGVEEWKREKREIPGGYGLIESTTNFDGGGISHQEKREA